ncbi:prephenate dehydratase [Salinibacillus xinjiangensis]|uniref:Prephenate dehydratase n=1 Tax=Salinibacillus xinjiangensis TaxID=1229268 RepID=A0A6G1XBE8_9BACI|nr:prephenate dehydratase [Salinibacillus xinjiangensis]MRG88235.1 prephenate dehydratase [Salinibacillus xinjiangensis]
MNKVGYLGPKGTFTKMAVDGLFDEIDSVSYKTIPACIDAVNAGEVDLGVVPIENAIEGSVHLTLDYLIHHVDLPIVAEATVPIRQHLLVHPSFEGDIGDIEEIYSHTQAISQCHQFIHQNAPQAHIEYTASTGQAAQLVLEKGARTAAIANEKAAREIGLKILKSDVHDYPNNHTRFVVLKQDSQPLSLEHTEKNGFKTSIMVTLPRDYAGALHQVLSAFSWRQMNLSKIESRPMKTGLGNYFFIIDVNQEYDDVLFPGVQAELRALGCQVRVLGSYPTYVVSDEKIKQLNQ